MMPSLGLIGLSFSFCAFWFPFRLQARYQVGSLWRRIYPHFPLEICVCPSWKSIDSGSSQSRFLFLFTYRLILHPTIPDKSKVDGVPSATCVDGNKANLDIASLNRFHYVQQNKGKPTS